MIELKLPERLRDVDVQKSMSDAQKSASDVQKSVAEISEAVSEAVTERLAKLDLPKVEVKAPKVDIKAKDLMKRARVDEVLPRKSGPSPLPFLLLGMIGGLVVGIWAATSATIGPMIRSAMGDAQDRLQGMMSQSGGRSSYDASRFGGSSRTTGYETSTVTPRSIGSAGAMGSPSSSGTTSQTEDAETTSATVGSMSTMGSTALETDQPVFRTNDEPES